MAKGLTVIFGLIFCLSVYSQSFAQSSSDNNSSDISGRYDPEAMIKRLSYENFKHIKLLSASIINYGGGEEVIDKLIDNYAEASALYFQNKYTEASTLFSKNEKDIFDITKKIVDTYFKDTEKLFNESIRINLKKEIRESLKGESTNEIAVKYISAARFAIDKGNDIYFRYKDATLSSPRELINGIYYYRRAKENIYLFIESNISNKDKIKQAAEKKEFNEKYKIGLDDNKNKISKPMEKQN